MAMTSRFPPIVALKSSKKLAFLAIIGVADLKNEKLLKNFFDDKIRRTGGGI
jgi:hypothetical protein